MDTPIRYGCIGAGGIARKKHLPGYLRCPEAEVRAVCDVNPGSAARLAQDFGGLHIYQDFREMIRGEKLELVSICTPNDTHARIALEAMELGCHVHIEKPMALRPEEAAAIAACEQATGRRVLVGLNKRYQSEAVLLERLLEQDFFGPVCKVRCGWERNSGIPGSGAWFTDEQKSGGGALIDLGVHYLDWALSVLGYPEAEAVAGTGKSWFLGGTDRIRRGYRSDPGGICNVEDFASGSVRMEDGSLLEFTFSWASNIRQEIQYLEVIGKKGGMSLRNGQLELYCQQSGVMFTMVPDTATMPEPEDEFRHFIHCILTGAPVKTGAPESLKTLGLIDKIYQQIRK